MPWAVPTMFTNLTVIFFARHDEQTPILLFSATTRLSWSSKHLRRRFAGAVLFSLAAVLTSIVPA